MSWENWLRRLAGETLPIVNEQPEPGFYRYKGKNDPVPIPVAYWINGDGTVSCRIGRRDVSIEKGEEIWSWCANKPVSETAYRAVAERGEPWPDIDPAVSEQMRQGIGGNQPPDEHVLIAEQIGIVTEAVNNYTKVTSDEQAAQAQTVRGRLLELKGQAEKAHKAEKQPHLDAGRAADQKWLPLAKAAQAAADAVRTALSAWETVKMRKQREAEAAAAKAGQPAPVPAAPPTTQIKGAIGKAASVAVVKVVKVMDFDAVYANFRQNVELQKLLTKLAQAAVDAGYPVPGITVDEERRVK